MSSDLETFLRSRRSVRRFQPGVIPEKVVQRLLQTAAFAPSAHDKQPWRFVVVASREARDRLIEAITKKFKADMILDGAAEAAIIKRIEKTTRRIQEAPLVIVLFQDLAQVNPQPDEARQKTEQKMGAQSVALAGFQLLLAAHAEGLAGTWICWPLFAPDETCKALDVPAEWEPQGMLFIGIPAENPDAPTQKPLSEIVRQI